MLGENIKKIRLSKALTIKDLADSTGLTVGYLSNLERGEKTNPSYEVIQKIANALSVPMVDFYKEEPPKNILGYNIKRLRKEKNITLKDLEEKTGITNSYISAIENGRKINPSQEKLEMLANALNVNLIDFYFEKKTSKNFLGENIKNLRTLKKLTIKELEKKTGISKAYICDLENGKRTNPSQETLEKLAEVLDTTISELYSKNTEYKQEVKTINNDLAEIMDYLKKDSIYYNGMKLEEQEISFLNASINATIEQIKLMRKNK